MLELNRIYNMDCLIGMKGMDGESVHCCVTSPPYYGLRDYGIPPTEWTEVTYTPMSGAGEITVPSWKGCLGLEPTIEMFVAHTVLVFREVRRVLRKDGTLWMNFGDSYSGGGKSGWDPTIGKRNLGRTEYPKGHIQKGLKPKDLMGIPWRVAFALQADGWYLRQDIVWAKPNPMPESVRDRCTKSHEYLFLFSRSKRYYFDAAAIQEPISDSTVERLNQDIENQAGSSRVPGKTNGPMKAVGKGNANGFRGGAYCNGSTFDNSEGGKRKTHGNSKPPTGWDTGPGSHGSFHEDGRRQKNLEIPYADNHANTLLKRSGNLDRKHGEDRDRPGSDLGASVPWEGSMRNKRDVWTIASQPFKEAHFATFPPKLIEPCILAGCPQGGIVFDPFMGSGTTAQVATELQRNFIGFEIKAEYIGIANEKRLAAVQLRMV